MMNIDSFNELNWAEKPAYYRSDSKLKEAGFDNALDNACFWVQEYMGELPSITGFIGDRGEHIKIKSEYGYTCCGSNEMDSFRYELDKLQKGMPLLSDEKYSEVCGLINKWFELYGRAEDSDMGINELDPDTYLQVCNEFERTQREIEGYIFGALKAEYDSAFDDSVQLELLMNTEDFEFLVDDESRRAIDRMMRHGASMSTAIRIYSDMGLAF